MTSTYPIVGLHDGLGVEGVGSRPIRYEFNNFVDPLRNRYASDQLNLFLQALERMQKAPKGEVTSWLQVGGIHGQPYSPWDGAEANHKAGDGVFAYCEHSTVRFPTWHRVYVLLMEQAVHKYMTDVLDEFPQDKQAQLKPAVDHWRMPYWDWANRDSASQSLIIPELLKQPTVSVLRPNGLTVTIANPLSRYAFPMKDGKIDGIADVFRLGYNIPFSTSPYTIRQPPAYDTADPSSVQAWQDGLSDNTQVETVLNSGLQDSASRIYRLYAATRSYPSLATATVYGRPDTSLEAVHNNVHKEIGGSWGHMTVFDVAGFDPIFWMHHGNVEHVFSVWQALNPSDYARWPNDKWLSGTQQPWFDGEGKSDHHVEALAPLFPFHKDDHATNWNSNACRDIGLLGYAYEELQYWKYRSPRTDPRPPHGVPPVRPPLDEPAYCRDIRKMIAKKYGWAVPNPEQILQIEAKIREGIPDSVAARGSRFSVIGVDGKQFNDYVVQVVVDRFAFEGFTFSVHIFLGEGVPTYVRSWHTAASQVGTVVHFGGSQFQQGACANCQRLSEDEAKRQIGDQVSLTKTLLNIIENGAEYGGKKLRSLSRDDVSEFLRENLHWRVSTLGDKEEDVAGVSSLRVSVAVCTAVLPSEEGELISYGEYEEIEVPTKGRAGGIQ